ncbi:MAG: hypothetical protein K6G10_01380 [Butyrivibrio sp.]|nr:hypothetical protein [Butyrivibrio sp.]
MYDRKKDMTKKGFEELNKKNRVLTQMNTGTRTFATDKHPSRARDKEIQRKICDDYER